MLRGAIPVLHVSDADRAEEFYTRMLGFRVEFTGLGGAPRGGPRYFGVVRDKAALHFSSHAGDGVVGGIVYIVVDDVDALRSELKTRGTPVVLEPTDQTWGMRELYVRDPDGNTIRFGARTPD